MPRAVIVALLLLLPACNEEAGGPAGTPSPTPQDTVAASEPETTEAPLEQECTDETITGNPQVTILLNDNAFSPKCLVVLGGQGLELMNEGSSKHNFSIDGTDVDLDTESGEATRTEALSGVLEPGTFEFFCKYHRALGMVGEITLTDAG